MTEYSYKQCPVCGIHYAVDKVVMDYKHGCSSTDKDRGWYCPNGHPLVFRESDADKYRHEAERLRQRLAQKDDEIAARDRQLIAAKGQITKARKRASAGTCPCCKRTFSNMARHMKSEHPDFASQPIKLVAS